MLKKLAFLSTALVAPLVDRLACSNSFGTSGPRAAFRAGHTRPVDLQLDPSHQHELAAAQQHNLQLAEKLVEESEHDPKSSAAKPRYGRRNIFSDGKYLNSAICWKLPAIAPLDDRSRFTLGCGVRPADGWPRTELRNLSRPSRAIPVLTGWPDLTMTRQNYATAIERLQQVITLPEHDASLRQPGTLL